MVPDLPSSPPGLATNSGQRREHALFELSKFHVASVSRFSEINALIERQFLRTRVVERNSEHGLARRPGDVATSKSPRRFEHVVGRHRVHGEGHAIAHLTRRWNSGKVNDGSHSFRAFVDRRHRGDHLPEIGHVGATVARPAPLGRNSGIDVHDVVRWPSKSFVQARPSLPPPTVSLIMNAVPST